MKLGFELGFTLLQISKVEFGKAVMGTAEDVYGFETSSAEQKLGLEVSLSEFDVTDHSWNTSLKASRTSQRSGCFSGPGGQFLSLCSIYPSFLSSTLEAQIPWGPDYHIFCLLLGCLPELLHPTCHTEAQSPNILIPFTSHSSLETPLSLHRKDILNLSLTTTLVSGAITSARIIADVSLVVYLTSSLVSCQHGQVEWTF